MRSIHTTKQIKSSKNNTPDRVIHQHRTKLGNPIWSIIPIIIISSLVLSLCLSSTYTHAESSVSLSVNNNDVVLELTVPTTVSLGLTPNSANNYVSFGTTNLNVSAGTNNPYGYILTMSALNTNLVNSDVTLNSSNNPNNIPLNSSNHPIIPTITSTYSDSNFPNNAWGYRLSTSANYTGISSTETTLVPNGNPGNATPITLNLAAKVDATQPAGTYITTINFATVAITPPPPTLTNIDNMQDMTMAICAASEENETKQLKDTRDNKYYWVAKLADGNCWMTQNLDLNIDSTKTYTPEDTDISANWTPTSSTYATGSTSWDWSYTTPESYDPGNLCWNGTLDTSWSGNLDNMTESCSEGSHYQIGNYYNWTAAVAMENSEEYWEDGLDADQSICPAGWRLPTYSGDKSYANLISEIGNVTSGTSGNIQNNPLYFVYGGNWYGSSNGVGSYGDYWSSVVYGDDDSYRLDFDVGGYLDPRDNYGRGYGFSVRCVAR